jgi:Icc-related predicted phosphoesterase
MEVAAIRCFFASDLHGDPRKYRALFDLARSERPRAVLLGGDLLGIGGDTEGILQAELLNPAKEVSALGTSVITIMGNDDPRVFEALLIEADSAGVLGYAPLKALPLGTLYVAGYPYVPPTPFQLKDWERYDVSRYVDPGCVAPEDGRRTVEVDMESERLATIRGDMERLAHASPPERTVYIFHSPPYKTNLDVADIAGKTHEHAPLDVHIGSIAIREFIETRQPLLTLHGHAHESARLTGSWRDRIGSTEMFSAAHDGDELSLVRFDTDVVSAATRELIPLARSV